jgi:hypothetical protein
MGSVLLVTTNIVYERTIANPQNCFFDWQGLEDGKMVLSTSNSIIGKNGPLNATDKVQSCFEQCKRKSIKNNRGCLLLFSHKIH